MKNLYLTAVLLGAIYFPSYSQQNSYPMETVGTPGAAYIVNSYTGWANNGVLSFAGDAEVQNTNPSNHISASGGGNVRFAPVTGTHMEISGFVPGSVPQSLDITFAMHGYNPNNLSELLLEYSTDGINYTPLTYRRLFRNYLPPTPWDVMVSDPLPGNINFANLKIRFRQTVTTQEFRVDDIEANFHYPLPIKLVSFSGSQSKGANQLQWTATATHADEYFVVEKSTDGRRFNALAQVQVKNLSIATYSFSDAAGGKAFYRLRMVDAEGKSAHSSIIYLDNSTHSQELIQRIYPVPARQVLNTQLYSSRQERVTVMLVDMAGRIVMTRQIQAMEGINNCPLDVASLGRGTYILKIIAGEQTASRSVVIQ